MLQIKDIVKQYKDVTAVNGISFNVEPGKIFGLMGPNGAGKTTTIRMIMNIIEPSSGTILYNGEPVAGNIKNIVGYLPEERGLYKKSKVSEVIAYMGALKGADKRTIEKRTDEWLSKLEITGYKNKKIEELSKGNQQKIQFICSVIHDPEILVFDEPFSGFDPINQQNVKDIIMDFVKQGKIIILSTHQMDLAEKLCESIFL
ncbi:MAG: ATP-binding cassette domain-containing protein, partial [Ignavibacteriaceae bacterium]|nr:ATP-binding cassette domain-containing protein [Ignavibacteriaceae bacterium]